MLIYLIDLSSNFDLKILDEAHNTTKKHPFNRIMDHYHKMSKNKPRVSDTAIIIFLFFSLSNVTIQVLALTASPPAHIDLEKTNDMIQEFEKNVDCKILLVDEFRVEMRKDVSIPRTIVHPITPSKREKSFLNLVTSAMTELEAKIKYTSVDREDAKMQREIVRGSPDYYVNCPSDELKFLNSVLITFYDSMELAMLDLEEKQHEFPSVQKILNGIEIMGNAELTKQKLFLAKLNEFKVLFQY